MGTIFEVRHAKIRHPYKRIGLVEKNSISRTNLLSSSSTADDALERQHLFIIF